MFCSVCGSQNAPQLRFCRACGKPLSSAETLSADADDPLKTRLSIPADQSALKAAAAQPPPSGGADPMATVVGMQAVKPLPNANANASSAPDPFATQVGGQGLNIDQLKELAAKSAVSKNNPSPASNEVDSLATVVGMPAVNLPIPPKPAAPAKAPSPAQQPLAKAPDSKPPIPPPQQNSPSNNVFEPEAKSGSSTIVIAGIIIAVIVIIVAVLLFRR
ncbi:MAG: zinc ribbon domain-containing protein [Blastocatellia bacterium]|nr:zinc ribbon domain-containing protein [Blastocatellia bacterium]